MKLFKYKKVLAVLCAAIILFTYLSIPSSAYSNYVDKHGYNHSNLPLIQDCPVPINITYQYSYRQPDVYVTSTDLVSSTLLPFVSETSSFVSEISIEDYFDVDSNAFYGNIYPLNFEVESFSSDPSVYLIGDADFSFIDLAFNPTYGNVIYTTGFITLSLRDFYCWNYSFDSRINRVDSEISLSSIYHSIDIPLHSIDVYYSLAGDSQLNFIKFDAQNYPGILTGDITFTPDMFGYSGDTIVYIYSADIYFTNGPNQSATSGISTFSFDAHYVFNPYIHNVNYAGSPGGSLPLANYTGWIADAVSGFLDFEIYDGFSLGGIFMCIIAFLCAMWFLKLVAGG